MQDETTVDIGRKKNASSPEKKIRFQPYGRRVIDKGPRVPRYLPRYDGYHYSGIKVPFLFVFFPVLSPSHTQSNRIPNDWLGENTHAETNSPYFIVNC